MYQFSILRKKNSFISLNSIDTEFVEEVEEVRVLGGSEGVAVHEQYGVERVRRIEGNQ